MPSEPRASDRGERRPATSSKELFFARELSDSSSKAGSSSAARPASSSVGREPPWPQVGLNTLTIFFLIFLNSSSLCHVSVCVVCVRVLCSASMPTRV